VGDGRGALLEPCVDEADVGVVLRPEVHAPEPM
jgi:hypothetical protein